MGNRGGGSPIWLAGWRSGPSPRYVRTKTAGGAIDQLAELGLPRPDVLEYAGYQARPGRPDPELRKRAAPKPSAATGRRTEAALTIYSLLRVDWPIGSILSTRQAADRWRVSNATLRDFLANVGSAIERLEADPRVLVDVVDAQGRSWWYSAVETNARRTRNGRLADWAGERRILYRERAIRLRQRREYSIAVGELAPALDGVLERDDRAADQFRRTLIAGGLAADDAESMASRFRRITIPKL